MCQKIKKKTRFIINVVPTKRMPVFLFSWSFKIHKHCKWFCLKLLPGYWFLKSQIYVIFCVIGYHLYNLKNIKNTHGGMLLLACNFTKSNALPWVFFTFFKLYNRYQIAQRITYHACSHVQ